MVCPGSSPSLPERPCDPRESRWHATRQGFASHLPPSAKGFTMVTTELGACEWFVWDLRRSNLLDRGRLDQIVGEFLAKNPRAEPPALSDYLVRQNILTQ